MLVAKKEEKTYNRANLPSHRRISKKHKSKKSNRKVIMKLKVFGSTILILIISLTIVLRYAYITQSEIQLRKLDKDIQSLMKEKQELVLNLEKVRESQWIEKEAKERLGMTYPTREQTVYISVNDSYADTEVAANQQKSSTIFLKAFGDIVNRLVGFIE